MYHDFSGNAYKEGYAGEGGSDTQGAGQGKMSRRVSVYPKTCYISYKGCTMLNSCSGLGCIIIIKRLIKQ